MVSISLALEIFTGSQCFFRKMVVVVSSTAISEGLCQHEADCLDDNGRGGVLSHVHRKLLLVIPETVCEWWVAADRFWTETQIQRSSFNKDIGKLCFGINTGWEEYIRILKLKCPHRRH